MFCPIPERFGLHTCVAWMTGRPGRNTRTEMLHKHKSTLPRMSKPYLTAHAGQYFILCVSPKRWNLRENYMYNLRLQFRLFHEHFSGLKFYLFIFVHLRLYPSLYHAFLVSLSVDSLTRGPRPNPEINSVDRKRGCWRIGRASCSVSHFRAR